jgi:hypothetical protein
MSICKVENYSREKPTRNRQQLILVGDYLQISKVAVLTRHPTFF